MKCFVLLALVLLFFSVPVFAGNFDHIKVSPQENRQIVIKALESLAPRLQQALQGGRVEIVFGIGDAHGVAVASDAFGMELEVQSVYVRWPAGSKTVKFPWGEMNLLHATRHELAHLALERIFIRNSSEWVGLVKALNQEGVGFLKKVAAGHRDAQGLGSPSSIAHHQALQEYLASLVEHCGKPVRMPLPSSKKTRQMVEALVRGGECDETETKQ